MKLIPLTQGQFAIVDDEDYESLTQHKWYASFSPKTRSYYAVRNQRIAGKRKKFYIHREIMNPTSDQAVDHINHDTLDNRRCNLRICSAKENNRNCVMYRNNASGAKGVYWDASRGKWHARIRVNRRKVHIGRFDSIEEAAAAYDSASVMHFGAFALTNYELKAKETE